MVNLLIEPAGDFVSFFKLSKFKMQPRHRHLLAMVLENRLPLIWAMGCMLMMAGSTAASAYLIKPVLDDIFFKRDMHMLKLLPLVVVGVYFLRGLGMYGQEYFMTYVGEKIIQQLRNHLFARIMGLPLAFFHQARTGVLMSRITHDVNVVKAMVSTAVTGSLRDFFTIVGLTVVIFYRDWQMALFAFVILPIAFLPVVIFGRRVRRVSTGCQASMAEVNAFLHETFSGIKIVKAFGMEAHENSRFVARTRELFDLEVRAVVARSISSPVMEFLGGLGVAFIIWYGGYSVISGRSTAGTFFSFMAAVLLLYDPVKKLSKLNNAVQEGLAAVDRIYEIIETRAAIESPAAPRPLPQGDHRVQFEDVSFGYDQRGLALEHIDLNVAAGEIIALVGMSGGGKTSLVNLIPRFYDVSAGRISINGVDIRQVALNELRQRIAIVTQEPILFNDTVRNNIAYGNPQADERAIVAAARAAYAHEFICGFDKGYDTPLGELGGRLSGGERQRMCIARAILKDAPILILDEATSSLDSEAERWVQKALENLMRGRTTFVIAHRLSTIGYASRILVIADGKIVEQGTHADLMARQCEYYKLHQMQYDPECSGERLLAG